MEDLKGNHKSEVMKLLSNIDDSNSGLSKDMLTKRLLGNSFYFTEYEIPGILSYTLNIDALKALIKTCIDTGTSSRWKYFTRIFFLTIAHSTWQNTSEQNSQSFQETMWAITQCIIKSLLRGYTKFLRINPETYQSVVYEHTKEL